MLKYISLLLDECVIKNINQFRKNKLNLKTEKNMNKTEKEILDLFAEELRRILGSRVKRILLYGSRARGDNDLDSDYDFLVILSDVSSDTKAAIDEIVGEFLYQYDIVFSVLPKEEKAFNEYPYDPIFINAFQEGIPL